MNSPAVEFPPRQLAVIASTMRSGSTLLKSLLATAGDVSDLPEVNFQRFARPGADATAIWKLAPQRIVVLKRPAWYHEVATYPKLPAVPGARTIVLIRDAYDTVESLRKMSLGPLANSLSAVVDSTLLIRYWARVTSRLLDLAESASGEISLIRYEDLVARPREETARLFQFLGSSQRDGVDRYQPPAAGRWRWGSDDNSQQIRSLAVQPPRARPQTNSRLVHLVKTLTVVADLRRRAGYSRDPAPSREQPAESISAD